MIEAVLSSPGMIDAVLTQAPMIINDYVFTVAESDSEYIFTARRGNEVQTLKLPKSGNGESAALPPVTEADNGKVMTVVDGAWAAEEPEIGIPVVTINGVPPDENGNFVINTMTDLEISDLDSKLT